MEEEIKFVNKFKPYKVMEEETKIKNEKSGFINITRICAVVQFVLTIIGAITIMSNSYNNYVENYNVIVCYCIGGIFLSFMLMSVMFNIATITENSYRDKI